MKDEPDTYYDVLGVPPDATAVEIRHAYISLARRYHPDISRDPDANQRMAAINLAYETLSDAQRRLQYDIDIGLREPASQKTAEAVRQDWSWLRCEKCDKRDATLRISISMLVMSFLIVTSRRGAGGGLLCSTCRAKDGIWFSLVSLVLGPWGFPWGIVWTIHAIWTNTGGGIQLREANAQLLRIVSAALYSENRYWEAADALTASLSFQEDPQTRAALPDVRAMAERVGSPRVYTSRGLDPTLARLGFFGAVGGTIIAVVIVVAVTGGGQGAPDSRSLNTRAQSGASVALPGAGPTFAQLTPRPSAVSTSKGIDGRQEIIDQDLAAVAAKGYGIVGSTPVATGDGFGHNLIAIPAHCDAAVYGHCMFVHFFVDTTYLGTDTSNPSASIPDVAATGPGRIAVTYPDYAAWDPLCCPSLLPVTVTYTWDGERLTPNRVPPGH